MIKPWQKFIGAALAFLIIMNPFVIFVPEKVKADTENSDPSTAINYDVDAPDGLSFDDGFQEPKALAVPTTYQNITNSWQEENDPDNNPLLLEDKLGGTNNPKIILNADDAYDLRSLSCIAALMPDFTTNTQKLFDNLPASSRPATAQDLIPMKLAEPDKFYGLVSEAQNAWHDANQGYILNDINTLECLTGLSENEIADMRTRDPEQLTTIVNDTKDSLTIDRRIIKTLVYLVTPKNQGGAGHYRIRVQRIRSGYTSKSRQLTRESDYTISQLKGKTSGTVKTTDIAGKTAAEIGMTREITSADSYNLDGTTANAVVEDQNGTQYDAYINQQVQNEDTSAASTGTSQTVEPNISAHADGEAIDISEVDDIRCTLIKKKRIGGSSKSAYSARPIKLAWQTQEGYAQSGGNDGQDLSQLFKQSASDDIRALIEELGGDISNFDGDISQGNFSDIVQIVGQSLFSQIINSPSANFSGYNFQDTLQKIGSIYFADFLGLPKEIFVNQDVNSLDDLQRIIGQAAVEERLGLPFGTFSGSTLEETLQNIGQNKMEQEMNLNPGAFSGVVGKTQQSLPLVIGQAAIEKSLSLKTGSFGGNNFSELKKNIGEIKGQTAFIDSSYVDSLLHLVSGTTDKLKSNQLTPTAFAELAGQIRLDDTAYGFKYLAANESAYNLPAGTWDNALLGQKEALKTIGVSIISKVFGTDDEQKAAMQQWLISNTAKQSDDDCAIKPANEVEIITGKDSKGVDIKKTVLLSEEKAIGAGLSTNDFFKMFGCAKSNPANVFEKIGSKALYYALVNYGMNSDQKFKINLMDTNPEYKLLPITQIEFYLTRIMEMDTITSRIKKNWEGQNSQFDYQTIMSSISKIGTIVGNTQFRSSKDSIQTAGKRVAIEIGALKAAFEKDKKEYQNLKNKIDSTLIDVDRLVQLTNEILEGKETQSVSSIQTEQIPASILSSSSGTYGKYSSAKDKIDKVGIMLVLARKVSPKDFFLSAGTEKTETELGLPQNSLYYYVKNTEQKGLANKDAFYQSIGQAQIEAQFGMPSFYFQGPVYKIADKPDFKNDMDALMKYNGFNQDDKLYASTKNYILQTKINDTSIFNYYIQQAENTYNQGAAKFAKDANTKGNAKSLENNVDDVVTNIKANGLTDGIRSAENDLLFRMGLTGNLQSLTANSPIAWSSANSRAKTIDKQFGLKDGTTKSLFTGSFIPVSNGKNILGQEEKKIIAGKLEISTTAVDKYLQALNGDINANDLTGTGQEIFYNSSNPYATTPPITETDQCPNPFTVNDKGISISKQFVNDSFGYRDKNGIVFAQNQESAKQLRDSNPENKITFLAEFALGLAKITGKNQNDIQVDLLSYLKNTKQTKLYDYSDAEYAKMEESSGIPVSVLQKLFQRQSATSIDKPLLAYKAAVGKVAAQKIISWKIFKGLGIDVNSSSFDSDSLFEIMNGNFKPLYNIGASLVDKKLNLPSGTTETIMTTGMPKIKSCALAEAGANMLGRLVGLNYISLKGNILTNFGQSKIEETLNLPRGTFKGTNITELANSVAPINFALAFKVPLDGIITTDIIQAIFGPSGTKMSKDITDEMKLLQIKNYLGAQSMLTGTASQAVTTIDNALKERILQIAGADPSSWNGDFLDNAGYLDSIFNLAKDSTKDMLSGKITPNAYRDLVANKTLQNMAALGALQIFGLDEYQSQTALNLVANFKTMIDKKQYGDIYTALSEVFNVNLDAKAGFTQGTFANIFNDPKNAGKIILSEGIKKIDRSLGLVPNSGASLTDLYIYYQAGEDECKSSLLPSDQESTLKDEEIKLKTANSGSAEDAARLAAISQTRSDANKGFNDCKKQLRGDIGSILVNNARAAATQAISDKIWEVTKGTVGMPKEDINKLIRDGDMRYFQVAGLAYAANTILDQNGNQQSVPAGMRVSYNDIYLAVFGSRDAESFSENAAIYADLSGTTPEDPTPPYRYGDICTTFGTVGCLSADGYLNSDPTSFLPRDNVQLVTANEASTQHMYGYNPSDNSFNDKYQAKYGSQVALANSDQCKQDPMSEPCQQAYRAQNDLTTIKDQARRDSRQVFVDDLKYKTSDALLWKLDKNAFPGFSYAMMRGDTEAKQNAMATYIRNGILRGELFGLDVGFKLPNISGWIDAYNFFTNMGAAGVLDNFLKPGGGYTVLNDFMNKNAAKWFGFALPPDMIGGLIVGAATGVWDPSKLKEGDWRIPMFDGGFYKGEKGNIKIPTMKEIGSNLVETKLFGWTDKIFGWDTGTSLKIYQSYKNVQKAKKAYETAREAYTTAKTAENTAKAQEAGANYDGAKADLIAFVVTMVFSKQIASAEESLGLVPGTGAMLVTMLITGFNPIGLAVFILYNLFGVYKVELKCSADGYYPEMQPPPSANEIDITGLGVWDGKNQETTKQMSIKAAQYKANRLIGDMLEMQDSPKYKDIIPSQIMTGRQEDVDFWDSGISHYICSKIGSVSVNGICGGNTRAGVWKNPQTVALTHIGF